MKLLVVLAAAVSVVMCTLDEEADYYCGKRLATTMAKICFEKPRSVLVKRAEEEYLRSAFPWLTRPGPSMGRGKRDGIIEECCHNPCTLPVLMTYC